MSLCCKAAVVLTNIFLRTVENAFTNINETLFSTYNGTTLNASFDSINETINTGIANQGYLFATLTAYNSTASDTSGASGSSSATSSSGGSGGTDLAMWVLFSPLFLFKF